MLALAFALLTQVAPPVPASASANAQASAPPSVKAAGSSAKSNATVVVLDDRGVKDQAPSAMLQRVVDEIGRRRSLKAVRMSDARKKLDARADKALAGCVDDAGCLAAAARDMGGDVVVTVRLTKREGAFFLALTRVNALRPQDTDDAATLAGTEQDALAFVKDAVGELFPGAEIDDAR